MLIRRLGADQCSAVVAQLMAIDAVYVAEGVLELWTQTEFMMELPDKWILSQIAYDEATGEVIGYRIASGRGLIDRYAHSHRTAILQSRLREGIASKLLEATTGAALALGYRGISGKCMVGNHRSEAFLRAHGWTATGVTIGPNQVFRATF